MYVHTNKTRCSLNIKTKFVNKPVSCLKLFRHNRTVLNFRRIILIYYICVPSKTLRIYNNNNNNTSIYLFQEPI